MAVTVTDDAGQEHAVTVDDVKMAHFVYDNIFIGNGYTTLPGQYLRRQQRAMLQAPATTWLGYVGGQHAPVVAENGSGAKGMTYSAMCLHEGSITDLARSHGCLRWRQHIALATATGASRICSANG